MTVLQVPDTFPQDLIQRVSLVGVLELACQELDLTPTQYDRATTSYMAVGEWLANGCDHRLRGAQIYPQGSVALETANRPLIGAEFDVDSVDFLYPVPQSTPPALVKQLLGNRLREHGYYSQILEEKPRCWRLNYEGEFHLDVTPSITNPACPNGGELVPDKKLQCWKPTNPKGFTKLFQYRSSLIPSLTLQKVAFAQARATIENLPTPKQFKGFLRRCVQLSKRHRDVFFQNAADLQPISVIITTLNSRSYEFCVKSFQYDTEFDLLLAVTEHMPDFIERPAPGSYAVWNETTEGENFAEKWNRDNRLAQAFYRWHAQFRKDLQILQSVRGMDEITKVLGRSLGEKVGGGVGRRWAECVSEARRRGSLAVIGAAGLATATAAGAPVTNNTFHGR